LYEEATFVGVNVGPIPGVRSNGLAGGTEPRLARPSTSWPRPFFGCSGEPAGIIGVETALLDEGLGEGPASERPAHRWDAGGVVASPGLGDPNVTSRRGLPSGRGDVDAATVSAIIDLKSSLVISLVIRKIEQLKIAHLVDGPSFFLQGDPSF
jgi:hypothetical protein